MCAQCVCVPRRPAWFGKSQQTVKLGVGIAMPDWLDWRRPIGFWFRLRRPFEKLKGVTPSLDQPIESSK